MPYATIADVTSLGFPAAALGQLTQDQVDSVLQAASDHADSYFRARFGSDAVPFTDWDSSVTNAVAKIAALWLLRVRGYNPQSSADQRFQLAADEAEAWLGKVQRQQAHPKVVLADHKDPEPREPRVRSFSVVDLSGGGRKPSRGW